MSFRDLVSGVGCADDSSGLNPLAQMAQMMGSRSDMHRKDEFRFGGMGMIPHPEIEADPLNLQMQGPPQLDPEFQRYLNSYASMQTPQQHHRPEFDHFENFYGEQHQGHLPPQFREFEDIYSQRHAEPPASVEDFSSIYDNVLQEQEFDNIYNEPINAPVRSLGETLKAFIMQTHSGELMGPSLVAEGLSAGDKMKIRDRCSILGRHLHADEQFADAQLNELFKACQIDPTEAYEDIYKRESRDKEFDSWLDDYEQEYAEYEKYYGDAAKEWLDPSDPAAMAGVKNIQDLVQYLKQQNDPKWRNSKFVDFLGKMSSGEIQLGEDGLVERSAYTPMHLRNRYAASADPFQEGLDLFANGMLPEAIEAFEAEIQAHPDNSNAWKQLGLAHAENDEDDKAVSALQMAIRTDPENLDALIAMSVSHANLLNHAASIDDLRHWLDTHFLYKGIPPPPTEDAEGFYVSPHEQCVKMFIEAVKLNPEDADLHVALGVLFNLSSEYPRAVEAFQNAIKYRPDDYTLWNKLGATLANSSRSAEAVEAYRRCLEIKPTYVRGWTNMGISHTDQGNHAQAAEYYLGALAANPRALHVWGYLTALFHMMERPDLVSKAAAHDINLFRNEFTF